MPAHSIYIFDRKGKTLFTKNFAKKKDDTPHHDNGTGAPTTNTTDEAQLAEQRKLIFGMLYSLKEVVTSLTPEDKRMEGGIRSIQTAASTLHVYESNSGLRFALVVTTPAASSLLSTSTTIDTYEAGQNIQTALHHIYNELWINSVTRSPMYNPIAQNVSSTTFEHDLDAYLTSQSWFR